MSCSSSNKKDENRDHLVNLLRNEESHNKYVYINSYLPAVMTRGGYDYVDAYLLAVGGYDYFFYEKAAIDAKLDAPLIRDPYYFACIYVNNEGKLSHVIKRKIYVEFINNEEFPNGFVNHLDTGIFRFIKEDIVENDLLIKKITSIEEFDYIYICKENDNTLKMYKFHIKNSHDSELIKNYKGKALHKRVPFHKAEFIYDEEGNFVDLQIIEEDMPEEGNLLNKGDEDLPQI